MANPSSGVYNFLSDENSEHWKGLLQPALRKIQKQVHPRFDIDDDTLAYLEELIYSLLAQMCAAQPHVMMDVENYVQTNFTAPIDTWALSDAQLLMDRAQKRRGVFVFPVERLFALLQKEVFGYKIELILVQYIMAILDYVSADILKLAGNFVKNTRKPAVIIRCGDVKVSMSADPALQALIQPLQGGQAPLSLDTSIQEMSERKPLTYDELLRQLVDEESQYVRHLNLILKVFMEPFNDRNLFLAIDVEDIFYNLTELLELSIKLLADLDECIEMSGEIVGGNSSVPQVGIIFEDIAESFEFEVYTRYAANYIDATCKLEELLAEEDVVKYFKSSKTKLFKEAMQYILPSSLLEPVYHCFFYFDVMEALVKCSPTTDDKDSLESAISCAFSTKMDMDRVCTRFLPKRKDDTGMFGKGQGYGAALRKVVQIQQKIEGWEGPDIFSCCTKLIKEGSLGVIREGGRRAQKTERHVFLLDGLAICCKTKSRGSVGEYRLKEKINMRRAELTDLEDADDLKFAFQLVGQDQPAITFYAISKLEKNEWMAALTLLLTCSTFDRLLDLKLSEEEQNIDVLTPDPNEYIFAEKDSEDNILFDEVEIGKPVGGPGPPLKAGTIHKLVERLTYHEYADPSFVRTFLMTYRSFSEPQELLDLLVARFLIPMPIDIDEHDRRDPMLMKAIKRYKANYISPIQLRVFNVLRHWVEFHYYDFDRDPKLLEKLRTFVCSVKNKSMQKWVMSINRAMAKKEEEKPLQNIKLIFDKESERVEWHIATKKEDYHILTLHPVEIARQLTLIQSDYFRAILPSELVDASWMKDEKKEKASPNLLKLNRFETTTSNWLAKEIVFMENFEERVALVSRLIDIMEELRRLNNFAGMFVINAALESASVFRLKHTFKALHQKRLQVLEDMKQIASSYKGYKNYKEKLRSINPPCVPFLGMYMTWIVFIKDGSENNITGKADLFINFKKRRKIADVLQEIQQYQNSPYCLTQEQSIQDWILSQDPMGNMAPNKWEDYIFDVSRSTEPKDMPAKKVARQYKFELKAPRGYGALGTLIGRTRHRNPNLPSLPEPESEGGVTGGAGGTQNSSPGATPPVSPFELINGVSSPEKKRPSSGRSRTASATTTGSESPIRPPKLPTKNLSMTHIHCPPPLPDRANSQSPPACYLALGPPRIGPKPGERKLPHLPPPNNDLRKEARPNRPPPPPPPSSLNPDCRRPLRLPDNETWSRGPNNEIRLPPHVPRGLPDNELGALSHPPRVPDNDFRPPHPLSEAADKPPDKNAPLPLDNALPQLPPRKNTPVNDPPRKNTPVNDPPPIPPRMDK